MHTHHASGTYEPVFTAGAANTVAQGVIWAYASVQSVQNSRGSNESNNSSSSNNNNNNTSSSSSTNNTTKRSSTLSSSSSSTLSSPLSSSLIAYAMHNMVAVVDPTSKQVVRTLLAGPASAASLPAPLSALVWASLLGGSLICLVTAAEDGGVAVWSHRY
jgi:cytoskeletal protein RodZ